MHGLANAMDIQNTQISRDRKIKFYIPGLVDYQISGFQSNPKIFPAISITGSSCSLRCNHCKGKVLETMLPAKSPEDFIKICRDLKEEGCIGCLVSGGCNSNGTLPIEKFIAAFGKVKKELELKMVIHTGLVNKATATMIKQAGIDIVVADMIGSQEILRKVYRLDAKIEDFERSIVSLIESDVVVVPHITVGLNYGRLDGEIKALNIIRKYDPPTLVITVIMPLSGTPMENVKPPNPTQVTEILKAAKAMMPRTSLVLGCARPSGEHRVKTDILALKVGVDAIAFPTEEAVNFARLNNLPFSFSQICCSFASETAKPIL
jgi:uncharacterized radical SAM superfamily protein